MSLGSRLPAYDRLNLMWVLCYCAGALLGLRLLQVQVVQNVYYSGAAERNRTKIIRQTAPRGRIYGRNGEIIATNQAAFSLIYIPMKDKDERYLADLARDLAPIVRREPEDLLDVLRRAIREESAIRLAENLPPKIMFKLSELKTIYPGVDLIVEARRYYPNGAFASHLLGYMGRMDDKSWKELKNEGYRVDSKVGRAGIEKLFERELRGTDGGIRMEVDAQGRLKRVLERIPWRPGSNIHLTIDSRIQKAAEEALRRSKSGEGAVVALDPRNGDILALASVPDFDPNQFLSPDSTGSLANLPEFNLAIQGTYAPGSTFKIVSAAAMLNEGKVNPKDTVYCPGYLELGRHIFLCWEPKGHHKQDFIGGLTFSCDVYFYRMGLRTGGDLIEKYERLFGLGAKTRIALPGEKRGFVFGPQARASRRQGWYDGDTCNLSIGQGELLVTPIQMAVVIAATANRGTLWRPHFVGRIEYADRPEYRQKPEELGRVPLKKETWDVLHAGLENVIKAGTGGRVFTPGLLIGGKTGTAQNPHGEDNAWFVAYAGRPGEEPSIALAVLVQHGGHGSEAAGPVAKAVIHAAFGIEDGPKTAPAAAAPPAAGAFPMTLQELRPAQPPVRAR